MIEPLDPLIINPGPERISPTMRQLVVSTIVGIGTHPRIKNPGIFYPYRIGGQPPEEIKIQEFRTYGGIELENPGLTCSVYPLHTPRDSISSTAIMRSSNYAQTFKPYTLGGNADAGSIDEVTTYLVIELGYQDSDFDRDLSFKFTEATSLEMQLSNHSYNQMLSDGRFGITREQFIEPYFDEQTQQLQESDFVIRTSIGEAILTEYMDLIRLVLNDLPTLRPFAVRATQVKAIDYSTSNWLNRPQNLNFHQAYLIWEISFFSPKSWRDIYFTPVREIGIDGKVIGLNLSEDCPCDGSLPIGSFIDATRFLGQKVVRFTQANLTIANLFIVRHNLQTRNIASLIIWNNESNVLYPDDYVIRDENTLIVNLSAYIPIVGTWTLIIGAAR